MAILPSARHRFDIPDDVTYLNCAYMSPLSKETVAVGQEALARKAQPWTLHAADFFSLTDRTRAAFASLLGAPASPDDIALVPAASYGMAVAARNLPLSVGERVLVLEGGFPSTVLTWREAARAAGANLVRLPRPEDDDWTRTVLDAIDERTAVAALPALHWLDGATLDLVAIAARLREVGAALVLDLTQSLGAMPFDLGLVRPDFLVVAGYKWLLCPYTVSFLYVAPHRQEGAPLEHHWFGRAGSENFSALIDYREDFQPGARRFDGGEPADFALLPAAIAGLELLTSLGVGNIADTAGALADRVIAHGETLGLDAVPATLRARHYACLRSPEPLPDDLPARLAAERIYVSVRGGRSLRVTPHVYNDERDVARLSEALERVLATAKP